MHMFAMLNALATCMYTVGVSFNSCISFFVRIKTKIGTVIEPMKATEDVEQFIKKTKHDKRKK